METKKVKTVGEGVKFERIRRITGYLVGTLDRFNNAKKAEVADRVIRIKNGKVESNEVNKHPKNIDEVKW